MHWDTSCTDSRTSGCYLSAQGWCQELINILNGSGDACPVQMDREGKRETQKRTGCEAQSEKRRGNRKAGGRWRGRSARPGACWLPPRGTASPCSCESKVPAGQPHAGAAGLSPAAVMPLPGSHFRLSPYLSETDHHRCAALTHWGPSGGPGTPPRELMPPTVEHTWDGLTCFL